MKKSFPTLIFLAALVALGLAVRLVLAWGEHLLRPRSRLRSLHG